MHKAHAGCSNGSHQNKITVESLWIEVMKLRECLSGMNEPKLTFKMHAIDDPVLREYMKYKNE